MDAGPTPPVIKREGQRDVACFHVDMEMIERMQKLLLDSGKGGASGSKTFTVDAGNKDVDLRLYHGLNACKTALIK